MPISIQQISYIHPDKEVLFSDLNFAISKGQKLGLVGNNGCGKSTLLQIIAGQLTPSSGVIVRPDDLYYIPQHFGQYDSLTIAQALQIDHKQKALHAILAGDASIENFSILNDDWNIEERSVAALDSWGLGQFPLSYPMNLLSGGEKTRVFLAGMDIHNPSVILMDEPTNHLDIDGREALINALNEYNGSVILITHDIHLIELIADNLWLVKDGCCRPYDGDLADYRNLLLAKTEPEKKVKPKPEVPKVNVREERKSVSARLRRVEREMEKLNADRAAIEAAFQTPLTSEEIIRSQKELAWISAALGEYEEEWLELSERLEQLGQ